MPPATFEVRALYRRFLRELPARRPNILANPSPVQRHIRLDFESPSPSDSSSSENASPTPSSSSPHQRSSASRMAEAEQYLNYLRNQRVYATLLERYNPGMNMDEEERVRLSARRVGMNLPVEVEKGDQSK